MAERNSVDELRKELKPVLEAILKKDCGVEVFDKAIPMLTSLIELMKNDEESGKMLSVEGIKEVQDSVVESGMEVENEIKVKIEQIKEENERLKVTLIHKMKDYRSLKTKESGQRFIFTEAVQWINDGHQTKSLDHKYGEFIPRRVLESLLRKLPYSSPSDDKTAMERVLFLTTHSPSARALFREIEWPLTKLTNPTSIQRSYSDASLQDCMVSLLLTISQLNDKPRSKIVQLCYHQVVPFLVACLRSRVEIRRKAAAAVSLLATVVSNRKKMGESGVIKALIELLEEGDEEGLTDVCKAIWLLCCGVVENREGAVSAGAIVAVVEKIKRQILVEEMLPILEALCKDGRAIAELEKNDMLECLFVILRGDVGVTEKGEEYCVLVIHAMCVEGDVTKINEVENGRRTLERVAITGTKEARKKATHLVWRLDLIDLICKLQVAKDSS